jgi:hypothetical protein
MMRCDAEWLQGALARYGNADLSPVLNLGSSTREFREVKQPFVHELVFAPLQARGVDVIHADLKAGEGVDISGDIYDDAVFEAIRARKPKSVLCTHMLEHVVDREKLVARMLAMLPAGGLFFVTVPMSYHHHADPIDTMYRPDPEALASLFSGHEILTKAELTGGNYWDHVRKRPVTLFTRHFFRFFVPFIGMEKWKRSMRKLYWLTHPYKVSAVAGRKVV